MWPMGGAEGRARLHEEKERVAAGLDMAGRSETEGKSIHHVRLWVNAPIPGLLASAIWRRRVWRTLLILHASHVSYGL